MGCRSHERRLPRLPEAPAPELFDPLPDVPARESAAACREASAEVRRPAGAAMNLRRVDTVDGSRGVYDGDRWVATFKRVEDLEEYLRLKRAPMTVAGERAREIVYGCRMGDQWTDTELISRIAAALTDLETANAELRDTAEEARQRYAWRALVEERDALKAEVERLRNAPVRQFNDNRDDLCAYILKLEADLRAATSAEAVKVNEQELAEVIATAIWHTPAGCEIDHLSVARQVIAFYDRAQAQKEEKHGPGTDH